MQKKTWCQNYTLELHPQPPATEWETIPALLLNDCTPGTTESHFYLTLGTAHPGSKAVTTGKTKSKNKGREGRGVGFCFPKDFPLPCPLLAGCGWSKAVKASSSVTLTSPECWDISLWISLWCLFPAVKLSQTKTYGFFLPLHYYSPLLDRGVFKWKQTIDSCYWV